MEYPTMQKIINLFLWLKISKVMEKCIDEQLIYHLEKNYLIYDRKYAFGHRHPTRD